MQNNEYSHIPFSECQVMTDDDGQNIYIYHNGSEVLFDYNHTGFYLETAIALFMAINAYSGAYPFTFWQHIKA